MKQQGTVIDIDTIRQRKQVIRFYCKGCSSPVEYDGTWPVVCAICDTTYEPLDEEMIRELGGLVDEAE